MSPPSPKIRISWSTLRLPLINPSPLGSAFLRSQIQGVYKCDTSATEYHVKLL